MKGKFNDTALIVTAQAHLLSDTILSSSGWISPEEREVADWLTLIRLLGWQPFIITPDNYNQRLLDEHAVKWVILTGIADYTLDFLSTMLTSFQSKPVLLIAQAGLRGSALASLTNVYVTGNTIEGNSMQWTGSGVQKNWNGASVCTLHLAHFPEDVKHVCLVNGQPIIVSKQNGTGKILQFSFHPSAARDMDGMFTSVLRHALIYESLQPVAWYKWENTVILRMDDPGSLEVVYNEHYQNTKLTEEDWETIGEELRKRNGSMTLGYVSGWVDDGDSERGKLLINQQPVERRAGAVYPSPSVRYTSKRFGDVPVVYDYESEYRGINKLREEGLVEIELHGYTHLHPNRNHWLQSTDKYSNTSWFREFGQSAVDFLKETPVEERPFWLGINGMRNLFGVTPTTLICPGDDYTNDILQQVIDSPLIFLSSYYLAIKTGKQMCWAQHVCAPYLNEADAKWFNSGLPIVGYFHDFDLSINGLEWFTACLKQWEAAGAKYFVDFRYVAERMECGLGLHQTVIGLQLTMDNTYTAHVGRQGIGFYNPTGNTERLFIKNAEGIEKDIPLLNNSNSDEEIVLTF